MFGQLCLPCDRGFGAAAFCVAGVVLVEAPGASDPLPEAASESPAPPGEADAPAMPAAAPPVAIAPATIVAPSILEMCMAEPPGRCAARASIVRHAGKRRYRLS